MSKEEIKKIIWDWETFSCQKEHISINEEVLSEWIDEFLKPKENENAALTQSDINDIYNSGVPNIK